MALPKNKTKVYSNKVLPGLSVLQASYTEQKFTQHSHETYSIGLILSGVNRFKHRGSFHYATQNTLCAINPGELHTGETCTEEGWNYINISPSEELLLNTQRALGLSLKDKSIFFPNSIIADNETAEVFLDFSQAISQTYSKLLIEQKWYQLWKLLLTRHVQQLKNVHDQKLTPRHVKLAREILDSTHKNISLTELAMLCEVSAYHLARNFTLHVGLSPHAYHLQKRIEKAKSLIQSGVPLVEAAQVMDFADQAHMTRYFTRHFGASPSQYRQ